MHPEVFKPSVLNFCISGFSQSGSPIDEAVSFEGQRELSSPVSQKEAPPAGQFDRWVGISNKAAEGPANSEIRLDARMNRPNSNRVRRWAKPARPNRNSGDMRYSSSVNCCLEAKIPKGKPSCPNSNWWRRMSTRVVPREATIRSSYHKQTPELVRKQQGGHNNQKLCCHLEA